MQIFRARTKAQLQEILAQYGWQNATESCWECDGQTLELDPEQLGRGHIQTRRVDEGQGISFIEVTVTAPATCQRCGHMWVPRLEPKSCPKCKTYYWNKPRKALERKERTMATTIHDDRGPQSIYIGAKSEAWCRVDDDTEGEVLTGTVEQIVNDRTFLIRSAATGRLWECRHLGDGVVVEAEPVEV